MNYAHAKSDNEIYWSPVPKPEEPQCEVYKYDDLAPVDAPSCRESVDCPCHRHADDLKAFEDGITVKYEDQEKVRKLLRCWEGGWPNDVDCMWRDCPAKDGKCPLWHPGYPKDYDSDEFVGKTELEPGTCLPIDVKGEVVGIPCSNCYGAKTIRGVKDGKYYDRECDKCEGLGGQKVFRITK